MTTLRFLAYQAKLAALKASIQESTLKSFLESNTRTLTLYWQIGQTIIEQQNALGRGSKVIDHIAIDLKTAFPDMKGISIRNLNYMRQFAAAYPDVKLIETSLNRLTWYHHVTLLARVQDPKTRRLYINQVSRYGWSRERMLAEIKKAGLTA